MGAHKSLLVILLLAAGGCGDGSSSNPTDDDGVAPETTESAVGEPPADLRADTNRDGVVRFDDPTDDVGEDNWTADHGAVFLANIDDDSLECPTTGDDVDLPYCNDALDDYVNGADDAKDLARLKTKPWPTAPAGATAKITFTPGSRVRLFKVQGSQFTPIASGHALTIAEIKNGIELGIEANDIVRNTSVWNGYVDVTYAIRADGVTGSDKVRLRVSPLMTYHHALTAEATWVSATGTQGNLDLRADLGSAAAQAGVPAPKTIATSDSWAQDFFEPAFMSMPAPGGKQQVIRVNIRSANVHAPSNAENPLRRAGKWVFAQRGKDVAAIQEWDPGRNGKHDTLNSFGNLETIPPYAGYPMGRILRGTSSSFWIDGAFKRMMEAQKVQPAIYVDTSWLAVGHVDETISFVKASTPRGWVMLVNDATLAKNMLLHYSNAGYGHVPMFVGKWWDENAPAQATIDDVLSDPDVMSASAEAAVEVAAQIATIKSHTGLTDAEIVRVPFLHMTTDGYSIAYQPGMVNGLYLADDHFVAPDPHGPVISGKDVFKAAMQNALAPYDIQVHFAEDWDTYHANMGEVHCGTNATRKIPTAKWWESGL
jgi:protein-arginine deiminase